MGSLKEYLSDERIKRAISILLRIGVVTAAAIVLFGGILHLFRYGMTATHYDIFHGEPPSLRTVSGIISAALAFDSSGIIQLGLLLLIATPIARVVFSVAAFAIERDLLYVCVTVVVLAVLLYDLVL